ncbi:glycosyltransferase [Mycobacterium sp. 1423905.2]|uniref:glycosyltransferase n=1 Tax=Mycobacterium sp. 1423905.2 TaxID=1856859 RepID=UPI0007FBC8C8|nr:glycosyltransferase [Mycobacterium sp. 1423905.2]OBJ54890.1 glycosyl transferase family 1 [Mycobacterium sp. 1423905.2]
MRIAIVHGDDLIGDECEQLSAALAGHGHQVTSYPRRSDQSTAAAHSDRGFDVVPVCAGPAAPQHAVEVLPFVGDWAAELASLWSLDPPDIVHGHGWLAGLAAQLAARRQNLPTVQTLHGLASTSHTDRAEVSERERARLEPLLVRNATWVTGGSSEELGMLARLRRNRARLSVLSAGVDVTRFYPVGPALDRTAKHRIVCVGPNCSPALGFDKTIRALPQLPGAELIIAETAADPNGEDERNALTSLAAALGVSDRVAFSRPASTEDLPMLLRSADVVTCTPRQAPYATPALQAMASGVAVVAVNVGALTDTIIHSVTGLLVSPTSPRDLSVALKTVAAQRFARQGMGAAGRLRAESRFNWDRIALDALNIYRQASATQPQQVASAS